MRSILPTRLRLGLTAQVWIYGVVIFLVTLLVASTLVGIAVRNENQARLVRQVDASLNEMSTNLERRTSELETLGGWLAQQQELAALIQTPNSAALNRYLDPIERTGVVDAIAVLDSHGTVVWTEKSDQVANGTENVLNPTGITDVLSGRTSRGLIVDEQGHLEQRLIMPFYGGNTQVPAGAVILAFYLDSDLLKNAPKDDTIGTAVIFQSQVVASSIIDPEGEVWRGAVVPLQLIQAASGDQPSEFSSLSTIAGDYLFKFRPLHATDRSIVGYYGAGIPSSAVFTTTLALPGLLTWTTAIALVLMLAFLLIFARFLAIPIQKLRTAAAAVAGGDLSMRIINPRNDEIGDIARALECIRQQWCSAKSAAAFEASYHAAFLQSMPAAAIITNADYSIVSANAAALALIREDPRTVIDRKWRNVFAANDRLALPATAGYDGERGRLSLRSQPHVILEVRTSPIQVNGQIEGYVHILQDVSEQAQFEQSKQDFVLNLAHELRSPLASLRAYIDLVVQDYAHMPMHDLGVLLRTLDRVAVKFQGLTENLIDMGSLQTGQFSVRPVPTPIGQLIDDAVDQTQLLLRAGEQRIEFQIQDPQALVWADAPRIIQVIVNLLNNANKYSPENTVITLSTQTDNGYLVVRITDHGDGITSEEQALIFTRYFRGKRAGHEGMGIGLGLALVKGIVQAHGGEVSVNSVPGETTFSFSLRMAP